MIPEVRVGLRRQFRISQYSIGVHTYTRINAHGEALSRLATAVAEVIKVIALRRSYP